MPIENTISTVLNNHIQENILGYSLTHVLEHEQMLAQ